MVPKPNMMALPIISCSKITVVKPLSAVPANFIYKVQMASNKELKKNTAPKTVMICRGSEEKEEIAEMNKRESLTGDHLLTPSTRLATWKGMA